MIMFMEPRPSIGFKMCGKCRGSHPNTNGIIIGPRTGARFTCIFWTKIAFFFIEIVILLVFVTYKCFLREKGSPLNGWHYPHRPVRGVFGIRFGRGAQHRPITPFTHHPRVAAGRHRNLGAFFLAYGFCIFRKKYPPISRPSPNRFCWTDLTHLRLSLSTNNWWVRLSVYVQDISSN